MRATVLTVLVVLSGIPRGEAWAQPARRAEAHAAVTQILSGRDIHGAISRLTFLGEEAFAARALAPAAGTPDVQVRRDVAQALALLAGPAQLDALALLADDRDGAVRMAAARGLGRTGKGGAAVLLTLLEDPSYGVRREAARALGKVGGPAQGARVLAAARAEDALEVRTALIQALGEMGAQGQRRALVGFLTSDSEGTQRSAARALCLLGASEGFAFVRARLTPGGEISSRLSILELLADVPLRALGPLARPLLEDPEPRVQAVAARLLARAGEKRAVPWLILAAERADPEARGPYRRELETLGVTEADRNAVLRKAASP